jgi:SAM-dependent methyltransferase
VGIDISPVAIELARSRAPRFLADGRASFRVAGFSFTGLEPAAADAVVSFDALPFAPDLDAALREIHRIPRVGGRLAFTAAQSPAPAPGSTGTGERHLDDAGFAVEMRMINAFHHEHFRRLYTLWNENAAELRSELGEAVANGLLAEAAGVDQLDQQDALLFVAQQRPG